MASKKYQWEIIWTVPSANEPLEIRKEKLNNIPNNIKIHYDIDESKVLGINDSFVKYTTPIFYNGEYYRSLIYSGNPKNSRYYFEDIYLIEKMPIIS